MEIRQRIGELELKEYREGLTGNETLEDFEGKVAKGGLYSLWEYWPTVERMEREEEDFVYGVDVVVYNIGERLRFEFMVFRLRKEGGKWGVGYYGSDVHDSRRKYELTGNTVQEVYDEFVWQVEEVFQGGRRKLDTE